MNNYNRNKIATLVVAVLSTGFFAQTAQAADSWNFKNGASSDWGRDPTRASYQASRDNYKVNFSQSAARVSYGNKGVTFSSVDIPSSKGDTLTGGGIANNTGFSKNFFKAKCGMVANGGNDSFKRTMASIWLNKVNKVDSFEVDVLEMAPGGGGNANSKLNWINWNKQGNGNKGSKATNFQPKWNNFKMATWSLSYNNSNRTFTAKNGNETKTHKMDKARTLGDVIVLHNKAWRFKTNAASKGKVATMLCVNASKNK